MTARIMIAPQISVCTLITSDMFSHPFALFLEEDAEAAYALLRTPPRHLLSVLPCNSVYYRITRIMILLAHQV